MRWGSRHVHCLNGRHRRNAARSKPAPTGLCDPLVTHFGALHSPQAPQPSTLRLLAGYGLPPQDTEPHV
ncbi:hypothetical protein EMIT0P44_260008 [Pseudomonas sp. IT-P44]